jgi:hypothetical protein
LGTRGAAFLLSFSERANGFFYCLLGTSKNTIFSGWDTDCPIPVFFKTKRVLEHWTPITVTLSFSVWGGLSKPVISTRAIVRRPFHAADAKSALAIWLLLVLTMAAYLITLLVTT